jgi:GR25 family glycosyltransferase involved in LPS biosynthesis
MIMANRGNKKELFRNCHDISLMIPTYVIAFIDDDVRRKAQQTCLNAFGFEPIFVDAVRGRDILPAEKQRLFHPARQWRVDHPMKDNALGCALSHYKAWKMIQQSSVPYGLILEDDAIPIETSKPFLSDQINHLAVMSDRLDVVILSLRRKTNKQLPIAPVGSHGKLAMIKYSDIGLESYFITRPAIDRLLPHPDRFCFEADTFLQHWWRHHAQVVHHIPSLFEEDGGDSQIGYHETPIWENDHIWHKGARRFWRGLDSLKKRRRLKSQFRAIRDHLTSA